MRSLSRVLPIGLASAVIASTVALAGAPAGQAVPNVSGVLMSTDGFAVSLSDSVQKWGGSGYVTQTGYFGNGAATTYFGSKGSANAYGISRGGIVKKTGGTCGVNGTYYQRSRVTLTGLGSSPKDVWAFWDGNVGAIGAGTSQWENASFASTSITGTSGQSTVTVGSAAGIVTGQYAYGTGIGDGATVTAVNGTTVTLSVANSGAVSGTGYFGYRDATTANLDKLCDGSGYFVTTSSGSADTIDLGLQAGVVYNVAAGLRVNDTTSTSVSFDVFVPLVNPQTGGWPALSLGLLVDQDGDGTVESADDYGIQTQVYARPWVEVGTGMAYSSILLAPCSSPSASDAPCLDTTNAADNGVFASDGTTRIGTASDYSVKWRLMQGVMDGMSMSNASIAVGLTGGAVDATGFEVPDGSVVKFKISIPTTGTTDGIDYASADFTKAAGQTEMRVNPADPANYTWNLATANSRTVFTVVARAATTSTSVNKITWQDSCQVQISGTSVSAAGCNVDANSLVVDTVPTRAGLQYLSNPVMQTIGGGLVSTNAQGMAFGDETMLGQSFQFAVAGPSYDEAGTARSAAGFYYVCVPEAFLAGSFNTTPGQAAQTWQGTRDGAVISSGVQFATAQCGTSPGLVASYESFGYSAPLFSVRPPAAQQTSSGSSSTSTPAATTTTTPAATTATPTQAPETPAVTPAVYPAMSSNSALRPAYLVGLAGIPVKQGSEVRISVPRMFRGVCKVQDGRVVAITAGTCGVRVKVIGPGGKVTSKRVYLSSRA